MNRQKRTPGLGEAPVSSARGGGRDRLRDAGSKDLVQLAKKVGNSGVGALLGAAQGKRDALLAFIERRLGQVQNAQRAEMKEAADQREWFLRVGRRKPGFDLLDPTRWRRTAQLYRRAAEALCRGDLGRGAQLLDQALMAERAAYDTVPDQVQLPSMNSAPSEGPEEGVAVSEGESCPPTQTPELFKMADEILQVTESMGEMPVERDRRPHNWWNEPEEEEKPGDGKKEDKKKTPPAAAEAEHGPARAAVHAESGQEKAVEQAPERAVENVPPEHETPEMTGGPAPSRAKKGRKSDGR